MVCLRRRVFDPLARPVSFKSLLGEPLLLVDEALDEALTFEVALPSPSVRGDESFIVDETRLGGGSLLVDAALTFEPRVPLLLLSGEGVGIFISQLMSFLTVTVLSLFLFSLFWFAVDMAESIIFSR